MPGETETNGEKAGKELADRLTTGAKLIEYRFAIPQIYGAPERAKPA